MGSDGYSRQGCRSALIVTGHRERVAAWVCDLARDIPKIKNGEYEAIGVINANNNIIGGVIYSHYGELPDGTHDIMMSCAGIPGWLTPKTLRVLFEYPFIQLACSRVTTLAAKANQRARSLNLRLGFTQEGMVRGAFGKGRNGILYGMLKEECRFIRDR
jgi:RimJ/RimL family protein N-acetyltransferase